MYWRNIMPNSAFVNQPYVSLPMSQHHTLDFTKGKYQTPLYMAILIAAILSAIGVALGLGYIKEDKQKEHLHWQEKLNVISDNRAKAVENWLDLHIKGVQTLAENPSLQLYFATLIGQKNIIHQVEPAQKSYLRNLLIFSADRLGFTDYTQPKSANIPTQMNISSDSGLIVFDKLGNVIVSTAELSALTGRVMRAIIEKKTTNNILVETAWLRKDNVPLGFTAPVYGIQEEKGTSAPSGYVLGIKPTRAELKTVLTPPGSIENTLNITLITKKDNVIYKLAESNAEKESKQVNANPTENAESYAAIHTGEANVMNNMYGKEVLFTSREIPNTPWILMTSITTNEAFAEGNTRRQGMLFFITALIVILILTILAVWHMSAKRRAESASIFFKDLADHSIAQSKLLQLVMNAEPDAVYILDAQLNFRFANQETLNRTGLEEYDLIGKKLSNVYGPARAAPIELIVTKVLEEGDEVQDVLRFPESHGLVSVIDAVAIPLENIPLPSLEKEPKGVLVVERDITAVVIEKEKRVALHEQMVEALTTLVDKRDPNAANHSLRVARIAEKIAREMQLNTAMIETTRTAGLLMNIGKITISEEMLSKGKIDKDELKSIRTSINASADFLNNIAFEGPVQETLRQTFEHWDGTGTQGLKGNDILISSRIIAAVNAYVSMTSKRSWREAMSDEDAGKALMSEAEKKYDRKVVLALVNWVENKKAS